MESSGKSNSRVIMGAQRARNKTVLMGADELEALRNEADASSVIEDVSDLLGAVEPTIEPESSHHTNFDDSLLDGLPDEEEGTAEESPEKVATNGLLEDLACEVSALDFDDNFESSAESGSYATQTPLAERDEGLEARYGKDEVEPEEARSLEMPFDDSVKPEKTRIVRVGAPMIPMAEVQAEVSKTEDSDGAFSLRDDSSQAIPTAQVKHRVAASEHLRQKRGCKDALVGFLVSFDDNPRGEFVELREGRMIVTSEGVGAASCLLLAHPSVCPMHAIMKMVCGEPLHILDQLSEFGTRIVDVESGREQLLSGDKGVARHGDVVYFGERKFHVCLVSVEMDNNE